jgi:hypothetical protein
MLRLIGIVLQCKPVDQRKLKLNATLLVGMQNGTATLEYNLAVSYKTKLSHHMI